MFLMSLIALGALQPAPVEDQFAVPDHQWVVDYGRMSCTLARRAGGEGSLILAFNAPLGREPGELLLLDGGSGFDPRLGGELLVRTDDGAPVELRASREQRNGRRVLRLAPMPEDFLERVAAAHSLSIARRDEVVVSLDLPDAREAVDALTRCNDDLLQGWGVDVAVRRALQRLPRLLSFDWLLAISPADDAALVFASHVSERGRPLDCRVVVSSGNSRMDRAVCDLVRSRARFEPALDSAGRTVRAHYVTVIRWRMSDW